LTKIYSAIYEHNMLTVNIYFFMRISRVSSPCQSQCELLPSPPEIGVWLLWCARHTDIDFRNVWSAYLTDIKDLLETQLIDDDNEVKLLLKKIMHLWHWNFSISIIRFDYHYHKFDYHYHKEVQVCTLVHRSACPSINWGSSKSLVSVRYALQSLRKSISMWRAHHSNHTTISGHNNATFRKSYILPFLTGFFLFFSELYTSLLYNLNHKSV
jgi:hypothetical protein